jgi:glycosyltransferase involved in cell wall biosynthesis
MDILYVTGRELNYPRNRLLYQFLHAHHHVDYAGRKTGRAKILPQTISSTIRKLPQVLVGKYPILTIGFYGHLLMLSLGLFSRSPILFDAFISTYDTLCFDRKRFRPNSIAGRTAFWLDKLACLRADRILLDTRTHAAYFHQRFQIPVEKLKVLYVGCDDQIFFPMAGVRSNEKQVLFYGSFLPTHGIDIIVQAARALRPCGIEFKIVGPRDELHGEMSREIGELDNLELLPPVPENELPAFIARAAVCLGGHFGATGKAGRVIAGKTYQCMAMGKPTIVGENPANHELLTHRKDAWFCKMNDPQALAEAITYLIDNRSLAQELGDNARQTYLTKASNKVLDAQLEEIVANML